MDHYPEHKKLEAVSDQSQTIGAFLEWIQSQTILLCRWQEAGTSGDRYIPLETEEDIQDAMAQVRSRGIGRYDIQEIWDIRDKQRIPNPDFQVWESGFAPTGETIKELLARYFGIDHAAIDAEKQQMLEALQRKGDEQCESK